MKTKLFTLFLAIAASIGTLLADKVLIGDLYYNLNATSLTAEVTYKSLTANTYSGDIVIPSSLTYSGKNYAVTSIGDHAFYNCSGLVSVTIPNSVVLIGDYAFFNSNDLKVITIGNSVSNIGNRAFSSTAITSIVIPASVTSIGDEAFVVCSNLSEITVAATNSKYSSDDGVLYNKNKTTLMVCPMKKQGEYIIPNSVTTLNDYAFQGCSSLTSVTIPTKITVISTSAFDGCSSLTSITIPKNVIRINQMAFRNCTSLQSVICEVVTPISIATSLEAQAPFFGVDRPNIPLYVPAESVDAYKAKDIWKEFNPILPIQNSPTEINNVSYDSPQNTKIIRDGQLLILREGKTYTAQGAEVK